MIKTVKISDKLRERGITENHIGFPTAKHLMVFGADTETVNGVPALLQISGPPKYGKPREMVTRVTPRTIFSVMMAWIKNEVSDGSMNLCFFHNLKFDQTAIFFENIQTIFDQYNEIRFTRDNYVVKMLYGKVNKAEIWEDLGGYLCPKCPEAIPKKRVYYEADGKGGGRWHCSVHPESYVKRNLGFKLTLLDSAAFCPPGGKSLKAALKIYGVPETKMKAPKGIGTEDIWDKPYARRYALNDARVERELALKILNLHQEYDVTVCVSLPQMAARILRHHFFKKGESLIFPPEPVRLAAEYSYHAGKNGFYVKRGVYENVFEYDINSAFPKAMRELPQMVRGQYHSAKRFMPNHLGLYRIKGAVTGAPRIPGIFNHDFTPIKSGSFSDVWVTGFELECLDERSGYDYKIIEGYVWRPDPTYHHSPLKDFVDRFWELKNTTPKGPKRDTYKNILNSLYGKFAACVEKRVIVDSAFGLTTVNDPLHNEGKFFVAGALYHPFIASQITGYVRRELYFLERKGEALHSATDSIKSLKELPTSDELGGIKKEAFGRCYLFRTKLYLHFSKDNLLCGHDLEKGWIKERGQEKLGKIFDRGFGGEPRQHLCKWALHGFKGSVRELFDRRFDLLKDGVLEYEYQHMVGLREGMIRGETISTMSKRQEKLTLPELSNADCN